jgi:hypothetical protein
MNRKGKYRIKKSISLAAILLSLVLVYRYQLLPRLLTWGATREEISRQYPGEEQIKAKGFKNTLAITVKANPSAIWPWIAQMGLNKGGFYSYTRLENLFGCKLKNANELHPAWQHPKAGDLEPVCKSQEGKPDAGWQVGIVEERKALVWHGRNNTEWMMGIYIDSINEHTSRLITRQQFKYPERWTTGWLLEKLWLEWAHCIMQRGMLNGIKKRVERQAALDDDVGYEPDLY